MINKSLYLMNVDWKWIKQRPQFIAEELSRRCKLICVSPHWYNRKRLQTREDSSLNAINMREFFGVPFGNKSIAVRKINNGLRSIFTWCILKKYQPDLLYVTAPEQYGAWMKRYKGKIIYDCMDNHVALSKNEKAKFIIKKKERKLTGCADIVLASSIKIKENLVSNYHKDPSKIFIVRNGYGGELLDKSREVCNNNENRYLKLGYIGTVSSWFDYDLLLDSLKRNDELEYHIIGPILGGRKVYHKRIIYEGVIEHSDLDKKVAEYDGLIMPFVVNDIVAAVDPVKLYEYINFDKPIITIYYNEIERLRPFVYFYRNADEFDKAIDKIRHDGKPKYSEEERLRFLKDSSWNSRVKEIENIIK